MTPPKDPTRRDSRGASNVVGLVMVLALSFVVVGIVVLSGARVVDGMDREIDLDRAEKSFRTFDTRASEIVRGDGRRVTVDFGLSEAGANARLDEGSLRSRPGAGWMRVRFRGLTSNASTRVVNVTLGSVVYVRGNTTIAYQGGGVWRQHGAHSVMLSPPEFHYVDRTVTLPIVTVQGDRSLAGQVRMRENGTVDRRFPSQSEGLTNRVRGGNLFVTVHSEYYRAWARYFRQFTDGYVSVDHDERTTTIVIPAKGGYGSAFPEGIIATTGSGYLELAGHGAYTDSYSSAEGPYSASSGENGTIVTSGDVRTTGNSTVYGDVRSGHNVTLDGETNVSGDVYWTEHYDQNGAAVAGTDEKISGVASIDPIDWYVERRVASIRANNDNDETPNVTDARLSISDDGSGRPNGTLTAGAYYLERLNLSGERLILDTTDGNVSVAVRDYVLMERGGKGDRGANVTVKGDGVARLFVASERKILVEKSGHNNLDRDRELSLYVSIDSEVYVPGNRAPGLRVFGSREFTMAMAGSSDKPTYFNGYVFAPAGRNGPGYAYLKQTEFYGGIVTGNLTIGQYASVHYDRTLGNRTIPRLPASSPLEFLHVLVYRVDVSNTE